MKKNHPRSRGVFRLLLVLFCFIGLVSCFSARAVRVRNESIPDRVPDKTTKDWYDYNTLKVTGEEEIFTKGYGSYVLCCRGVVEDSAGEAQSYILRGIAFPIEMNETLYFMSAGHTFDVTNEMSLRGISPDNVTIHEPEYSIDLDSQRYILTRIDRGDLDLAIFVLEDGEDKFSRRRYVCGNSDELRPGMPVLSWGMPLMEDFELSAGIVSALAAPRSLIQAGFQEAAEEDFFMTTMPTIYGCSGAPVYAFREGIPEIVGMLVAGYVNINRSVVYKINSIIRDSGLRG